jgi:hypothetical protein
VRHGSFIQGLIAAWPNRRDDYEMTFAYRPSAAIRSGEDHDMMGGQFFVYRRVASEWRRRHCHLFAVDLKTKRYTHVAVQHPERAFILKRR